MSTKISRIRYAIYHNPTLLKQLKSDSSINMGMLRRELKNVISCRIGIEFELAGAFRDGFKKKYNFKNYSEESAARFYGVYELHEDKDSNTTLTSIDSPVTEYNDLPSVPINEVRLSILNCNQLPGLYRFMNDLKEFCKLHQGGGIHIHLDLSKYDLISKKEILVRYVNRRLDEIQNILPKYKGKYNQKSVGWQTKARWVNFSRLNTLEIRILPLTFDYDTLIVWIRDLIKFRNRMISDCGLKIAPEDAKSRFANLSLAQDDEVGSTANSTGYDSEYCIDNAILYTRYTNDEVHWAAT